LARSAGVKQGWLLRVHFNKKQKPVASMHGKQTGLLCPAWLIAGRKNAGLKLLPTPAGRKQTNRCTEIMRM
jgi:hypothetical protein